MSPGILLAFAAGLRSDHHRQEGFEEMNLGLQDLVQVRIDEYRREAERVHRVSQALRQRKAARGEAQKQWWVALAAAAAAALHLGS